MKSVVVLYHLFQFVLVKIHLLKLLTNLKAMHLPHKVDQKPYSVTTHHLFVRYTFMVRDAMQFDEVCQTSCVSKFKLVLILLSFFFCIEDYSLYE